MATLTQRQKKHNTPQVLEEMSEGRNQSIAEIRSEIKLLARTIAALADDSRSG